MALLSELPRVTGPRLRRDGLGYRYEPAEAPVSMTFSRLVERREELTAELHVQTVRMPQEHVLRRRINLLGARAPENLAKELDQATDSAGWPWRRIVEAAFASVVESYRTGEDVKDLGGLATPPPAPSHLIDGLLIANVANTWFGPGGTGKSTAAIAACVAHKIGAPFAGREARQGEPLYLDWEDEEEAFQRILWEVGRGYDLEQSPRVKWRRMRGPLAGEVNFLTSVIDRHNITLLVIDSATRAMGSAGENGTYESTAIAFAEAIRALGKVTTLILDHVDGATVKDGGVAKKAYGSIHKLNFVRNAWSLTPDEQASVQTVGWTHAKVNHGPQLAPFGICYQRDPVLGGLQLWNVEPADVGPIRDKLPQWRQMVHVLDQHGPLTVKEIALELYGRDDDRACGQVRATFNRNHGKDMVRLPDGRLRSRTWSGATQETTLKVTDLDETRRNMRVVRVTDGAPDDLPF